VTQSAQGVTGSPTAAQVELYRDMQTYAPAALLRMGSALGSGAKDKREAIRSVLEQKLDGPGRDRLLAEVKAPHQTLVPAGNRAHAIALLQSLSFQKFNASMVRKGT